MELSPGQRLALHQLGEIAGRSHGALEILAGPDDGRDGKYIWVTLSLATNSYRRPGGLALRDRERLKLALHPDFPFKVPWLYFCHKRFVGVPHVQWGSYICLYQSSETEWNPGDGLFGFFERVDQWLAAAGSGQLDPEDAPLHPPVAYSKAKTIFVMRADAPPVADGSFWLGRADLKKIRSDRFDVFAWTHLDDWSEGSEGAQAAAVLFDHPLPMEFPNKVKDLIDVVEKAGLAFSLLYRLWRLFALMTPAGEPAHFIIGAPMRRKAAGEPLRQHLTVWEISADALEILRAMISGGGDDNTSQAALVEWMTTADALWCAVMEDRAEIVNRRDGASIAAQLTGNRILLLGCGALGSAVAETALRSGASAIGLVDSALVRPGILVRQRYGDADIGRPKAVALRGRLTANGLPCIVTEHVQDLGEATLTQFTLTDWDIIIDTTASARVGHRIEEELVTHELTVPMITMSVSAAAAHGSVAVRMPGYRGGHQQIMRQAKIEAFGRHAAEPLVRAFWPRRQDISIFQPEPGCSAPTFIGSAADIDSHAAGLLNIGLQHVNSLASDKASVDLVAAPWLEMKPRSAKHLRYSFRAYASCLEQRHGYKVLQSDVAARGMAAEMKRTARARSDKVETGGLIFGEIDDAHRHIWIDSVSGPPPDSVASPERFLCGTSGTKELALFKARISDQSSKFIGIWHTHPVSRGRPSQDDLFAMLQLLHLEEFPPRQIVMLIIGFAASHPMFNHFLFRREEFELIPDESHAQAEEA